MQSSILLLVSGFILLSAYVLYGRWLAKKYGIDNSIITPAHALKDDIDYVPAKLPVLFGHHFASIAGAAPIIGPIAAAAFGWVPVFLWLIIGGVFLGAMHDFGALFVSIRNEGKSIGEVIKKNVGARGSLLFLLFAWLTLILVVAAFTNVVSGTFAKVPVAASSSVFFIVLAVIFGLALNKLKTPLLPSTIVGVILLFSLIFVGEKLPMNLSANGWNIILLIYIFVASVAPVWVLLQPRDYLNSFLLYFLMISGFIGIVYYNPKIVLPAFTAFKVEGQGTLFPILFVTVACGAISGFHSIVASGTTAKQLNKETDAQTVAYGGMLVETLLGVMALITAAVLSAGDYAAVSKDPVAVFSKGLASAMQSIPFVKADMQSLVAFISLIVSAFALTSLDTATRLGRFIFQEIAAFLPERIGTPLKNSYLATLLTLVPAALLIFTGEWKAIWPLFGAANQLLAFFALLAFTVWYLKARGVLPKFSFIPMCFMFLVTFTALIYLCVVGGVGVISFISAILIIIAVFSAIEAFSAFKRIKLGKEVAEKQPELK